MPRRAERGEATVEDLCFADWTLDNRIADGLGRVGLDIGPDTTLTQLSGGQRTQASLAAALFEEPDFLILDESINHLDLAAITAVESALKAYEGALLFVSHDEFFPESIGIMHRLDLTDRRRSY
ncbi:ATP-binding cassette domain-containing protein [Martelella soudanensis]|uniref:ATP-binding cassette domain-containing protein n=1 Tax=unclassified Martelella TaxID=2629616 RepID=UPI0015E03DF6|nr:MULTISPECIES: ATP-binding cassette domain-containing protein [unclassified Martelella]